MRAGQKSARYVHVDGCSDAIRDGATIIPVIFAFC